VGDTAAGAATAAVALDAAITQAGDTVSGAATVAVALDAAITQAGDTLLATIGSAVSIVTPLKRILLVLQDSRNILIHREAKVFRQ
jgi:hypothetical protein